MLKTIFPDRQVLIRQNGDVRYLTFTSWLQCVLFFLVLAICVVAGLGSYQYVELNKTIDAQQVTIEQKQQELDSLHLSYREKHSQLTKRIAEMDDTSNLMNNMLDSLPEDQQAQFNLIQQQDSSKLDTTNTPDTEQNPVTEAPVQTKIKNEAQSEQLKQEPNTESDAKTQPKESEQIEASIEQKKKQLEQKFDALNTIVEQRTSDLLSALDKAGIDKQALLTQSMNNRVAQGGPLHDFDMNKLTQAQSDLLDKVVLLNTLTDNVTYLPTTLPAKKFYISSRYGFRIDPFTKRRAMHRGIDLAGWRNTKIYAPAGGIVSRAGNNGGYGKFIEIKHQNGFVTRYGHLAKIKVKRGQEVSKDQVIGLMGNTGRSTSTHLHYEVLHDDKYINPLKLTKAFENVLQ